MDKEIHKYWDNIDKELNKFSKTFNYTIKQRIRAYIREYDISKANIYNYMEKDDLTMFKVELQSIETTGYLKYKINAMLKRTKIKYYEALQLLIELVYYNVYNRHKQFEDELFTTTVKQTNELIQKISYGVRKPLLKRYHLIPLPNYLLPHLMSLPLYLGYNWLEYKENMIQYNANKMYRNIVVDIQQDRLDLNRYDRSLEIERKRYLTALDNEVASLNSYVSLWGMEKQGIKEVMYVAVMDNRTTKICQSMDRQVFKINGWNTYYRYANNNDERTTMYKTYGLQIGENQPALHYNCRSVLYPYK